MKSKILILLLGGKGLRFGSKLPKQFCDLDLINSHLEDKKSILFEATVLNLMLRIKFAHVIFVVHPEYISSKYFLDPLKRIQKKYSKVEYHIQKGGESRHESFMNACSNLMNLLSSEFAVIVHDANRPFQSSSFLDRINKYADLLSSKINSFIPVIPSSDSLCRITENDEIGSYVDRKSLFRIQTPQLIYGPKLITFMNSYLKVLENKKNISWLDEGSFLLANGFSVRTFPGDMNNTKITFKTSSQNQKLIV